MSVLSIENPVFVTYMIAASIMIFEGHGPGMDDSLQDAESQRRLGKP